jgi:hypothetical protein
MIKNLGKKASNVVNNGGNVSKKIVTVKIVAEIEVDSDWYDDSLTDEGIKNIEGNNWIEWIGDHVPYHHIQTISEDISIRDVEDEK